VEIRAAQATEASLLTAIAMEAKAHWGYSEEQLDAWRPELSMTTERIAAALVYVCEIQAQVAGFYALEESSQEWQLSDLWVRPAYMRRSIGRSLLQHAVMLAAGNGASHISIDADPNAEAFYLSCGARRVGLTPAPIAGNPGRQRPQLVLSTSRTQSK